MPKTHAHSIGQAARLSGLSAKTIRYYEEVGLIPRARRRTGAAHAAGDRVYGEADIGRLRFIRHARIVDLGLSEIRELLRIAESGCPSQHPTYAQLLRRHMRGIDERINHLVALRSAVANLLSLTAVAGENCCTWESCGCMQPKPRPAKEAANV